MRDPITRGTLVVFPAPKRAVETVDLELVKWRLLFIVSAGANVVLSILVWTLIGWRFN